VELKIELKTNFAMNAGTILRLTKILLSKFSRKEVYLFPLPMKNHPEIFPLL
jgi:hypothetical protein